MDLTVDRDRGGGGGLHCMVCECGMWMNGWNLFSKLKMSMLETSIMMHVFIIFDIWI